MHSSQFAAFLYDFVVAAAHLFYILFYVPIALLLPPVYHIFKFHCFLYQHPLLTLYYLLRHIVIEVSNLFQLNSIFVILFAVFHNLYNGPTNLSTRWFHIHHLPCLSQQQNQTFTKIDNQLSSNHFQQLSVQFRLQRMVRGMQQALYFLFPIVKLFLFQVFCILQHSSNALFQFRVLFQVTQHLFGLLPYQFHFAAELSRPHYFHNIFRHIPTGSHFLAFLLLFHDHPVLMVELFFNQIHLCSKFPKQFLAFLLDIFFD